MMTQCVYNLKRAIITVTRLNVSMPLNHKAYANHMNLINQYKESMVKCKRNSSDWDIYRSEIRRLRGNNQLSKPKKDEIIKPSSRRIDYQYDVQLKDWTKYKVSFTASFYDNDSLKYEIRSHVKQYLQAAFQRCRKSLKFEGYEDVSIDGLNVLYVSGRPKSGRVFLKPDQFLKMHVKKNLKSLFEDKKPSTANNYLGVEIEFCAPISEEKMAIELFKEGFQKYVQLKKDGSLRPQEKETGFEFAMLLKEGSYKKDLKKVTDFIAKIKGEAVDRRCGLHIHFDMRKRNKDMVFNNLVSCQNVLLSLVDPRRYNNEFCRVVNSKKFPINFKNTREERYKTINASAYYRHKTLEVRMHEGTVEFSDMTNWIDVLLKIVNHKKKMKSDISKLPILKKRVKLNEKVYKAVLDRSCFWQVNQADHVQNALRLQLELERETTRAIDRGTELQRPVGVTGGAQPPQMTADRVTFDNPWDQIRTQVQQDVRAIAENQLNLGNVVMTNNNTVGAIQAHWATGTTDEILLRTTTPTVEFTREIITDEFEEDLDNE